MSEHEELLARIAALERENERLRADPEPPRARARRGRAAAAVVLLVVGALLVPVAVTAAWARGLVTDTDRFVATVGPLAEDPALRQAAADRVTAAVVEGVDLEARVAELADALAALDLPPAAARVLTSLEAPLVDAATGAVRSTATRVVESDAFDEAWDRAARAAHAQLTATLRGDPEALATLGPGGTLSIDLSDVVDVVRERLVARGFTLVERLPDVPVSVPLLTNADLVGLQRAYRLVDVLGAWLPWLTLGLLAAGAVLVRDRARGVVVAGSVLAAGALALGVALTIGRSVYVDGLPPGVLRPDAALAVYDQVVAALRVASRAALALGAVAVVAGVLAGRSRSGTAVRGAAARLGALGRARGVDTGPVGRWLDRYRRPLRVVVVLAGVVVLVTADQLTPAVVGAVAVGVIVVLALVEALAAAARSPERLIPSG